MSKNVFLVVQRCGKIVSFTPYPPPFTSPMGLSPLFYCRAFFYLLSCRQKFGLAIVAENQVRKEKTMSTERTTRQIKKASYKMAGMLLGLLLSMIMDSIPIGFVLGLSCGTALEKRYT
jgi:hypothetical protein